MLLNPVQITSKPQKTFELEHQIPEPTYVPPAAPSCVLRWRVMNQKPVPYAFPDNGLSVSSQLPALKGKVAPRWRCYSCGLMAPL